MSPIGASTEDGFVIWIFGTSVFLIPIASIDI